MNEYNKLNLSDEQQLKQQLADLKKHIALIEGKIENKHNHPVSTNSNNDGP